MQYSTPSSLLALAIFFLVVNVIIVALRCVSRYLKKAPYGIDDGLNFVALLLTMAMSVNMIIAVAEGLWGVPLSPFDVPVSTLQAELSTPFGIKQARSLKVSVRSEERSTSLAILVVVTDSIASQHTFIQTTLFRAQMPLVKLSIVFFLRRIFCVAHRGVFHLMSLTTIIVISAWGILIFFQYLFDCGSRLPVFWEGPLLESDKYCLSTSIGAIIGSVDPVFDLVILILPLPNIFALHLSTSKRFLIAGVFLVGSLGFAASLVRFVMDVSILRQAHNQFTENNGNVNDSIEVFWTMLEAGFSLTTSCLPSVYPLISSAMIGIRSWYTSKTPQPEPEALNIEQMTSKTSSVWEV